MRTASRFSLLSFFLSLPVSFAADIPNQVSSASLPAQFSQSTFSQSTYSWRTSSVGDTAQLLTLFCEACQASQRGQTDVPLVAVLRDTLGDNDPENDRISSVWLLTYSAPNVGRRMLAAVPFLFWSIGPGSAHVNPRDTKPLLDITQPQHPVLAEVGRDLIQWTAFDPLSTYVRSSSREYRSNGLDDERLHLEEAVSYLQHAPVSKDASALTETQLDTVIARLELRKRLLGGLVTETGAARAGEQLNYEQERIRSRNWELLRQCAEKTGLIFESLDVAGTAGQYGMIWFPLNTPQPPTGISIHPVFKILNIHDPWKDDRLQQWSGPTFTRSLDANGALLPANETGARQVRLVPLAVYSLTYPKMPLLLVDFRNKLHVRWHEMTQRSVNEITAGVIGISHITNWYYYVAADLYDFITARHGGAMDQSARLDSYSQFRVTIALDRELNPELRQEIQRHVNSLAINPLSASTPREMEAAQARYRLLESQAKDGGKLAANLDKQRRAELAEFGESNGKQVTQEMLHTSSLGLYTHRVEPSAENLILLDRERRLENNLALLSLLADANTQPEVAYKSSRIEASVQQVNELMPSIQSPAVRLHVDAVLSRIKSLSKDQAIQTDCSVALASLRHPQPEAGMIVSGVVTAPRSLLLPGGGLDAGK